MVKASSFLASLLLFLLVPQTALPNDLLELKNQVKDAQEKVKALERQFNQQLEKWELLSKASEVTADMKTGGSSMPRLIIRGFSGIHFELEGDIIPGKKNPNSFVLGPFDLFITSALSDRLGALAELVIEFDEETNAVLIDLERIQLKFSVSDALNIRAGRMHTPFGYWNQTFHHGSWFQTSASRPEIYKFEDDGGILPVHSVGIQLFGKKSLDYIEWKYNISVINGRGKTVDEIQNVKDGNDAKAINFLLGISPNTIEGLEFGLNVYLDKIPPDGSVNGIMIGRNGSIDEEILGGYLLYLVGNIEFLAEFVHIKHDDQVSGKTFKTGGFYLMGAYQIDQWKPYYRFDGVNFSEGDPYFTGDTFDMAKNTLGIRWMSNFWSSLKLEYIYSDRKGANDTSAIGLHAEFTF